MAKAGIQDINSALKIIENHRQPFLQFGQQRFHQRLDLRVGLGSRPQLENAQPFTDVGLYEDLCLQAVGQHFTGLLGLPSGLEQFFVGIFHC